ncbi:unnamed protein product [Phaedon cochleariae]|uniref:Uncharacterized protein n=1 Tax=Phaedon cochleariae TaxID=80249 RepID=A0A9P0DSM1_PHACE|nr:unnamed protein product [Phaedon cochleariae]
MGQDHIIVTADLAIYSKAQEILWNNPPELANKITMQLGGMHLTMAFIASIGHIFGDGGLINILVESGVYAEGTCRQMLQGKQLNRALRGITLVSDVLSRLFFKALNAWMIEKKMPSLDDSTRERLLNLETIINISSPPSEIKTLVNSFLNDSDWPGVMEEFIEFGCQQSATFKYWWSFIDAANILLKLQRAERNADFSLHLEAVKETLTYLKAGGRNNYAKYTPIYLLDMENLKIKHPQIYQFLEDGNFAVRRTDGRNFNAVASDMALEQTVNKDCKSSGGVIGFTQSEQTLSRWLITRHLMGEYANKTKELITHKMKSCRSYGSTERIREEEDVKKMETLIEETWINPFDPSHFSTDLIHIATGKIASAEVRNSLSNFKEKANSSNEKFAKDRLTFDNVVSFWQPVPRDNLKAFGNDTVGYKKTGKQNYVNSDFMFRRVLCAAQYKDMDFADIMSYELTAVPVSIFHEDGTMRKTAKSDLATKFETYGPTMFESPSEIDSYFIDGMILLQEMNPKSFRTFQELGEVLMNKMIRIFKEHRTCRTISIIFDRYDLENSIKSSERIRRGQHKIGTYSINGSRNVPNYNIFLKSTSNKMSLIKFVTKYFIESHLRLPTNNEIIIAGGLEDAQICVKIHHSGTTEEPHLRCNHEEADTRLILHISTQRNSKIIIKSDDTDVFVLLLYYYWNDDNVRSNTIYMEKGHGTAYTNRRRFVAIHDVARTLKKRTCDGLPAFHVLTGCDTTSSFFKIGKKSAWDIYLKKKGELMSGSVWNGKF